MKTERDLVERAMRAWAPADPSFDSLLRRGEGKRRRQRVITGAVAIVIAVVAIAATMRAFDRSAVPADGVRPPFRIGREVLAPVAAPGGHPTGPALEGVDPSTGERRTLVDCADRCAGGIPYAAWSPDGTRLAYVVGCDPQFKDDFRACARPSSDPSGLWVLDATGRSRMIVSTSGVEPVPSWSFAWSPDSDSLAYGARSGPQRGLYVATGDLSDAEVLPGTEDLHVASPSWSPDGTRISFETDDGVSVASTDGTPAELLNRSGFAPQWSPDGSRIAYLAHVDGADPEPGLYVAGPDGSPITLIARSHVFTWSPDGSWIAYQVEDPIPGGFSEEIWVAGDDGRRSLVFRSPCCAGIVDDTLVWSPDGDRLAFLVSTDHSWRTVRFDGSDANVPVGELPTIDRFRALSWQGCLCTNENVDVP